MIVSKIKNQFPDFYAIVAHLKRLYLIKRIERLSKTPIDRYPYLLAKIYYDHTGKRLNWNNLQSYTEKMQWAKLYDSTPIKTQLTDKYVVRKWVSYMIGEQYLIPIIGIWNSIDEIDFARLPDEFVLKTNHGSGTNVIVRDKSKINKKILKLQFDDWMRLNFAFYEGFELHYSAITPKIIVEKLVKTDTEDLHDYKFLCFDGKPYFCWVDLDRYTNHKRNVYDLEWNLLPWNQFHYGNSADQVEKPKNFDEMVKIARILCVGFSHVRVDLYNVDGKTYFGEMTFTNSAGFELIEPEKYNIELGKLWHICE
jgi:hypothetical protein